MSKVVAAYARVSTDRQTERQTIEQQVAALRAYARERGWTARGSTGCATRWRGRRSTCCSS